MLAVIINFWDVASGRRRRTFTNIRTMELDGKFLHTPGICEGIFDIMCIVGCDEGKV